MSPEDAVTADLSDLCSDPLLGSIPVLEGYKVLGGVVLYQKLGQGGMGAVYKGKHLRLNVDVAVKIMTVPQLLSSTESAGLLRRFVREAQVAASINHQNLVRVIDVNTESDVYFLVMDYVDGESAGERLKRKENISEIEAMEIALGAAAGLGEAHRRGIVHRDVKPDNIMVDKEGNVRVTDLGLAKAYAVQEEQHAPSVLTETQAAMGTPAYMAPEQFVSARDAGPPADVWSLGVTLYQLLTSILPWTDSSAFVLAGKVMNEGYPDPRTLREGLSEAACEVIDRCLRKEAAERYADCAEVAEAIRTALEATGGRGKEELVDQAGSTSKALLAIPPPPVKTMTLIAQSMLAQITLPDGPRAGPRGRVSVADTGTDVTLAAERFPRKAVVPTVVAGGAVVAVIVIVIVALLLSGGDPLEARAEEFFRDQTEAAAAGRDAEVDRAIR